MPEPRVSIVIVNWKTPKLLAQCLQMIKLDPESDVFEVWVVDNASNDGSVEMLKSDFPYVKVIANTENTGFSKGCNQAIPLTTGPYILLLNPDAEVKDRAIAKMADFLDSHADCGAVGPK